MNGAVVGQEEMFVPQPTRKVIVQAGRANWWGVDPSSVRCAIATICGPTGLRGVDVVSFPNVQGPQRLAAIVEETRTKARELASLVPPGIVLIEQPSGKTINLELSYAVGATMAGIYQGVLDVCGTPARFESQTSQWWKKRSVGRGDVYKPKKERGMPAPAPEAYQVLRWAWSHGMPGSITSWDAADAWGMAEALMRDVLLEVR